MLPSRLNEKIHGLQNRWLKATHPLRSLRPPKKYAADFDGSREATEHILSFMIDHAIRARWNPSDGHFRAGDGYQRSPGGAPGDAMETAARTFIGAGYAMAGGLRQDLSGIYLRAIRSGCDPASRFYWKRIPHAQILVENASFIAGLLLNPDLWQKLEEPARANFLNYVSECSHRTFYRNNWVWFKIMHHLFLEIAGRVQQTGKIRAALDELDSFYEGDGWYSDGRVPGERRFDHYGAWAMHYYALLFCRLAGKEYDDRKQTLKSHAREFYANYRAFISERGPVAWGRSLIYRFGLLGFFGLYVSEGLASSRDLEAIKGLTVSTMRVFLKEDVFDADGLLTMGYFGSCGAALEPYSGSGSAYWAFKCFSFLLLEKDHSYWRARAAFDESVPAETPIPALGATVKKAGHGHRFFLNAGVVSKIYRWKYGKFAYSNLFLQTVDPRGADNAFVFRQPDGFHSRDVVHEFKTGKQGILHVRWGCAAIPQLNFYTTLVPIDEGYVLIGECRCERPLEYEFGGFCVPRQGLSVCRFGKSLALVSKRGVSRLSVFEAGDGRLDCRFVPKNRALEARASALPVFGSRLNRGEARLVFGVQASATGEVPELRVEAKEKTLKIATPTVTRMLEKSGCFYE